MIGKNVSILMPPQLRKQHAKYVANYKKSRNRKNMGMPRTVTIQRKDHVQLASTICLGEFMDKKGKRRFFATFIVENEESNGDSSATTRSRSNAQTNTWSEEDDKKGEKLLTKSKSNWRLNKIVV